MYTCYKFLVPFLLLIAEPVAVSSQVCKQPVATNLSFDRAQTVRNDLRKGGEIRYKNIGSIRGRPVELKVTARNFQSSIVPKDGLGGRKNNMGAIAMDIRQGNRNSGRATFEFCFVQPNTNNKVAADSFHWGLYDIDNRDGGNGLAGMHEKMYMDTRQATSFSLWPNRGRSEVKTSCARGGSPPCYNGNTIFAASTFGTVKDNAKDPRYLNTQQKQRSVVFRFDNKACWTFEIDIFCPTEPSKPCNYYGGTNFFFGGSGKDVLQGECIVTAPKTRPPTKPPTRRPTRPPTRKPTRPPTRKPTRPPTRKPTRPPTRKPTRPPTRKPTRPPTRKPTRPPTKKPTRPPTKKPTRPPTKRPTKQPTPKPVRPKTAPPTRSPTNQPSRSPTFPPTASPTRSPTGKPTTSPTSPPTGPPSRPPTSPPSAPPTRVPSLPPASPPSTEPTPAKPPTPPQSCSISKPNVVESICKSADGKVIETKPLPKNAVVVTESSGGTITFRVGQKWKDTVGLAVRPGLDECIVEAGIIPGEDRYFKSNSCSEAINTAITVVVYSDPDFDPEVCEACNVDSIGEMGGDDGYCAYSIELPCTECETPPSSSPTKAPSSETVTTDVPTTSETTSKPSSGSVTTDRPTTSETTSEPSSGTVTTDRPTSETTSEPKGCSIPAPPKILDYICKTDTGELMTEPIAMPEDALVITQSIDDMLEFRLTQAWADAGTSIAVRSDVDDECVVKPGLDFGEVENFSGDYCTEGDAGFNIVVYFDPDFDPDDCEACNAEKNDLSEMGDIAFCAYRVEIPCESIPVDCPSPTASPTTLSPTSFPTFTEDTVSCPSDIKVLRTSGVTAYPPEDARFQPVKIVSQDVTSVTVELKQAWDGPIDRFFYEYRKNEFSNQCFEETGIPDIPGTIIDRGFQIQCNELKPTAFLRICLQDESDALLNELDDGTVPKCCYSEAPEDTPTVCYHLEIACESECVEGEAPKEARRKRARRKRHLRATSNTSIA